MQRRVVSLWFPRLASERLLRRHPVDGPFALTLRQSNSERLYCLNQTAEDEGLQRGMGFSDARALCPSLQTLPADPKGDAYFLHLLARWAGRFCPWVGLEGSDGLVMDITGSSHLFGGELALLETMKARLMRSGLTVELGLADTRGAAWALVHFGARADERSEGNEGGHTALECRIAASGQSLERLAALPVAALRLEEKTIISFLRLGIRTIGDLHALPRASVSRRFGQVPLLRLDQALGQQAESIEPLPESPHYGVRMNLPEPIGLARDAMAVTERLLERLCDKLKAREVGARCLVLTLRRLDQACQQVELRLARAMHDATRILPLFERGVGEVDAGFGIDMVRLEAVAVEAMAFEQLATREGRQSGHGVANHSNALDDLLTRLGSRIGLENIIRFLPADSHIPERSFVVAPVAWSQPAPVWPYSHPRPLRLFPPEPVVADHRMLKEGERASPPHFFRWRGLSLSVVQSRGPERIMPEWWWEDAAWRSGLRDYWRVETRQGWRLWLFHTPQQPGWFVHGEFA